MAKETEEERLVREAIEEMERLNKSLQAQLDKLADKSQKK